MGQIFIAILAGVRSKEERQL